MRTPIIAALVTASLLAGCGGGGGSAPAPLTGGGGGSTSTLSAQDVAQSATAAAFEPIDTGEADAAVGSGSLGTASTFRSTQSASPQALGFVCKNRHTRIVTINGGTVTVETIAYYDNACTQLERDAVAVHTVSGSTETVNRTVTTYNQAHLQLGVRKATYTLTGSTNNGSWTIISAFYPGTSATPLSQYGHAATLSSAAYAATTGRIINDAKPSINASYGHQVATNATVSSDASNDVTFTGTRNGTLFKGALNGLTLSAAPPFTISGGTQLGSSALTGSVTFGPGGDLVNVTLNGTLAGGNTLAVTTTTSNGAIVINGTVTSPSGASVATFSVDEDGNGILTLANGTQVPIVDWHVVWG
jgi:hypothetical protein